MTLSMVTYYEFLSIFDHHFHLIAGVWCITNYTKATHHTSYSNCH